MIPKNSEALPPMPRSFKTAFPDTFLKDYQQGVMTYTYRGLNCRKSPIDLALYLQLLWKARPATIVELGTHDGGSALFFADMSGLFGTTARVITCDRKALATEAIRSDPRITVLEADAGNLEASDLHSLMADLPRPLLVVEDSAHTAEICHAVLLYFSRWLESGEYLIMEDGVLEDLGMGPHYGGGPNHAIARFMEENPGIYEVDLSYTDHFGKNATYNPNAYLRRH